MYLYTRISKQRFIILIAFFAILGIVLLTISILLRERENITLKEIIEEAQRNGLQPTTTTIYNQDDSVRIIVLSVERDKQQGNHPFARLKYVVNNISGRELLKVSSGCYVECSYDGNVWYPFSSTSLEDLGNNSLMLYNMGWIYINADSNTKELYFDKGETAGIIGFSLDETYQETALSLNVMPDGLYRLVFRFCEYVDLEEIITLKANLIDYGYYSVSFRVKDGNVC